MYMIYIVGIISLLIGALIGRFFGNNVLNSRAKDLLEKAKFSLEDAQKKADTIGTELERRKQIEWQVKDDEIESLREQLAFDKTSLELKKESFLTREKEIGESLGIVKDAREVVDLLRTDIERYHANARTAFETARQKAQLAVSQSKNNAEQSRELSEIRTKLEIQRNELETVKQQQIEKLERITGVSRDEAKRELKVGLLQEVKMEAASSIKKIKDEALLEATKEARKVVINTIQRVAVNETIENTVVSVQLESDDLKGRIIGKDGRNIRSFEGMTGIEVIVDDTPGAVLLSGFDPVRREIAKLSMVKLLADGRIHPARIEEIVGQVTNEVEDQIGEIGQSVLIDLGLHGLDPELVKIIGRMKFRTSYSQNLLAHSIEVAKLASVMASELGLDARMARRAGLLHDIGKVALGDHDSPHALVGRDLCKRYNEHPIVINAVGAHHGEIEMTNPISPIVQTADAISGARPGARRESLDNYVKRLEELEGIAEGFPGVQNAYAIQAGRELRVIVSSKEIDDAQAELLGDDIAKKIEDEVQYPGQIKITVIRELRSVSFAK